MNMSFYKKIISACLLLTIIVSCTHYIYIRKCVWQDKAVVADGKPTEWAIPLKYYDDKSKLQYCISNDRDNIYFCIRATDEQAQTKIFRAGMQLWIDTTGKNEHHVGILFPLANGAKKSEQNKGQQKIEEKHDGGGGFKNKFLNGYKEMELAGFMSPVTNGMNPIQNSYGILANINWDSSEVMTYEVVIPFKTFYRETLALSDSSKLMGVSIVLNGLPMPEGSGGGGSHGGGGRHGGGGMPGNVPGAGSGMPGGGGGASHGGAGGVGPGSTYLYETNSIKMTLELSVKKRLQTP
jgi:hypothetical protein